MKEDESNWFSKWESELPKPEELIPINQTLITPDLALAFDINNNHNPYNNNNINNNINHNYQQQQQQPPSVSTPSSQPNNSGEFDSSELGADEPARTLKRPRLVWTPQLHKRFVDAVAQLGIKHAVPKTIMQLMSVDGLTRENVASHLQKYRLYLKRMQGMGPGGSGGGGFGSGGDPVTDRLFASSPVPPHFLHQSAGHPNSDGFLPYMPAAVLQQQHHQQMAVGVGHQFQRHFGSPVLSRQPGQGVHMVGTPVRGSYVDDSQPAHEKKALTLFPVGDE